MRARKRNGTDSSGSEIKKKLTEVSDMSKCVDKREEKNYPSRKLVELNRVVQRKEKCNACGP